MAQPEKKVKAEIKNQMKEAFPECWGYMPVQTGYGVHGIPDHIYCVPIIITPNMVGREIGVFVAIEAKTEKGKLSSNQESRISEIIKAKGIAGVVYGKSKVKGIISAIKTYLIS